MLTDIFAHRYEVISLWPTMEGKIRRMLVQGYRIIDQQICPYWVDGNETKVSKAFWKEMHDRLSMELGVVSLSPLAYSYQSTFNGKSFTKTGLWTINTVCENWFMAPLPAEADANSYVKERLSFIEIGFRMRENELQKINADLEQNIAAERNRPSPGRGIRLPGDIGEGMRAANKRRNEAFRSAVEELNTRFRQAESGLHYHNGFIQLSADPLLGRQIEAPFWSIVSAPKWANVDTDMKEAIDRHDTNGRDAAFYAARALESTIKLISSEKGWSSGNERGAHNYIDNLTSRRAGFLKMWEGEILKSYFTNIRNPLSHGSGAQPMANLTHEETSFAIESAMVWIKALVRRALI